MKEEVILEIKQAELEDTLFEYIEQVKELFSPTIWENILLDCSKNEIFVLFFVYRSDGVNMTQIAEYIHVPLNTATGIVARMEKKKLISRERSREDKRVVTIRLAEKGQEQMQTILKELLYYGIKIFTTFTSEEQAMLESILKKVIMVLAEGHPEEKEQKIEKKVKKIKIQ